VQTLDLEFLYIVEPVRHSASELEENRALAEPAPALEGAGRNVPPFRKLILVEMANGHIWAPGGSLRCELPHCDTQIFAFIGYGRYGQADKKL
jgi:hypothetical protein